MNAFERRNFQLDGPIEQGIFCYELEENGQFRFFFQKRTKESVRQITFYCFRKAEPSYKYQTPVSLMDISVKVFSRSTENDPFIRDQAVLLLHGRIRNSYRF